MITTINEWKQLKAANQHVFETINDVDKVQINNMIPLEGKTIEKLNFFNKKSKEPVIEYKEEDGKFFKRNPSGGDWVEISEVEYNRSTKHKSTVMIHTSSSKNEDYDPAMPFEDEDLYHDIDWVDIESKFTQFASTYPKEQYASMRQTFNFLKEEILKYKMLN